MGALLLSGLLLSGLPPVVYAKPSEIDRQYAKDVAIDALHHTLSEIVAGQPPSAGFQSTNEPVVPRLGADAEEVAPDPICVKLAALSERSAVSVSEIETLLTRGPNGLRGWRETWAARDAAAKALPWLQRCKLPPGGLARLAGVLLPVVEARRAAIRAALEAPLLVRGTTYPWLPGERKEGRCQRAEPACVHEGVEAWDAGDQGRAFERWDQACRAGNALACLNRGVARLNGWSRGADVPGGVADFRKACEDGEPTGCHMLGLMAEAGRHVPQDRDAALRWLERGCKAGLELSCDARGRLAPGLESYERKTEHMRYACGRDGSVERCRAWIADVLQPSALRDEGRQRLCTELRELATCRALATERPGMASMYQDAACTGGDVEACRRRCEAGLGAMCRHGCFELDDDALCLRVCTEGDEAEDGLACLTRAQRDTPPPTPAWAADGELERRAYGQRYDCWRTRVLDPEGETRWPRQAEACLPFAMTQIRGLGWPVDRRNGMRLLRWLCERDDGDACSALAGLTRADGDAALADLWSARRCALEKAREDNDMMIDEACDRPRALEEMMLE